MQTRHVLGRLLPSLAATLLLAAPALAKPVGFLAEAQGKVEVMPNGSQTYALAAQDTDVSIGDTIRTGRHSTAKLVLVDDTIVNIDEETELAVDQYVVGPKATQEPSKLSLLEGHVRTRVGEAFGGTTRLELHTPTAVIGVKGTEWLTWYLKQVNTTFACVIEGIITVESNDPVASGAYEPPVGGCAKVLPHARPEPADLRDVAAQPLNQAINTTPIDAQVIEINDIPITPPNNPPPNNPPPTPPTPRSNSFKVPPVTVNPNDPGEGF